MRLVDSIAAVRDSKVPATAQVAASVWKRIKKLAIDRDCPPSEIVEKALVNYLEAEGSAAASGQGDSK